MCDINSIALQPIASLTSFPSEKLCEKLTIKIPHDKLHLNISLACFMKQNFAFRSTI